MTQLTAHLDAFEVRLRRLEVELADLRRLARDAQDPEPEPLWKIVPPPPVAETRFSNRAPR